NKTESLLIKPYGLTDKQNKLVSKILESFNQDLFKAFLINGVTGSGKTEVYMNIMEHVLSTNKGIIFLVPEISLTPQTSNTLKARFGDNIEILHSRLTPKEKREAWYRLKTGKSKIAVGPRSAVFAPIQNIGLIIIDEEHDTSYKQEESPRYNARDVAVVRAKMNNAKVILGSATPSLESSFNATTGKYELLELKDRVDGAKMPEISVIDMRYSPWKGFMISRVLFDKILNCLNRKEQVILFLNRRGSASMALCKSCGHVVKCQRCDLSLTHHKNKKKMLCHYCGYTIPESKICPKCGKEMEYLGLGTQKIEEEITGIFPKARIQRFDADSVSKKGSTEKILESFKQGKIDILVGTQMLAKGLDFHNVTLIGIISSDLSLNIPDFRSQERTYQLLTQVSGRAGRGSKKGEVIIQTFNPENEIITFSAKSDYSKFYKNETNHRKILAYPPYSKMIEIILKGIFEKNVTTIAQNIYNIMKKQIGASADIQLLGPSPMPISYINKQYRWHILLKSSNMKKMNLICKNILENYKFKSGVTVFVNVDPVNMI
ncbi:primosomal protein N', partial [bacterium]|nr:primosomal protein N' [bacterium]